MLYLEKHFQKYGTKLMPFTFSHPAYALPLKYIKPNYVSVTGLVLGSMAPDFEYFIMLEPYSSIGHSILGLFLQAIPLSIIIACIFHRIVKEQIALHLPSIVGLNRRAYNILGEWKLQNPKDWTIFILSVIIGFFSHTTIDAFTHISGYFIIRFSFLREIIFFNLPVYKVLQYGLSLFGLMFAFVFIINKLFKNNLNKKELPNVTKKQKILFWLSIMIFSFVVTGLKLLFTTSYNIIGILVVAPISGTVLGVIFSSIFSSRVRG